MKTLSLLPLAFILASCAREEMVDQVGSGQPITQTETTPEQPIEAPELAAEFPDETANQKRTAKPSGGGLRMPGDMLNLPQDEQLKSVKTTSVKDEKATLIAKPPE